MFTLRVTMVSGLVADVDAMTAEQLGWRVSWVIGDVERFER